MAGKGVGAGFTRHLECLANEFILCSISREQSLMGWGGTEGLDILGLKQSTKVIPS